jgi:hypothetical protein
MTILDAIVNRSYKKFQRTSSELASASGMVLASEKALVSVLGLPAVAGRGDFRAVKDYS